MNTRRCLKIASRMNVLLLRELGQGIDPSRMLAEPLYARDVLLVCDAMRDTELAELAPRFRHAATVETESNGKAVPARPGFSASRFLNTIFGGPTTARNTPPTGGSDSRNRFSRTRDDGK